MITTGTDSDGTSFQIWKQDQQSSCTIASSWMARGMVRRQSFAEGEWELAVRAFRNYIAAPGAADGVPEGPVSFDPASFPDGANANQSSMGSTFSNFGLTDPQILNVLRGEGLTVNYVRNPATIDPSKLDGTKCALVGVSWTGGGGHEIVAARQARNGKIVFLDPWDGAVNEQTNNGRYSARYGGQGNIDSAFYLS